MFKKILLSRSFGKTSPCHLVLHVYVKCVNAVFSSLSPIKAKFYFQVTCLMHSRVFICCYIKELFGFGLKVCSSMKPGMIDRANARFKPNIFCKQVKFPPGAEYKTALQIKSNNFINAFLWVLWLQSLSFQHNWFFPSLICFHLQKKYKKETKNVHNFPLNIVSLPETCLVCFFSFALEL